MIISLKNNVLSSKYTQDISLALCDWPFGSFVDLN